MREHALKAKRQNILIFCILAAIAAAFIIAVCVFRYQHTYSRLKWDANKGNRYQIVNDMLGQNYLVGMTESEVIELLGEEDSNEQTSFKIRRDYFPPESTLVYCLGVDFMDCNWLIISLQNGIVTDYCIDVT